MLSKIELVSDEELIQLYNQNTSYYGLAQDLGYKSSLKSHLKQKLEERLIQLGLSPYKTKIPVLEQTKGNLFNNRTNWQNARSAIQKTARISYDNSNKPKCCQICGYTNHIEIAHIKAVSEFDDSALVSEINNPNNLIALCPNHHWEYDNGILDISSFI